MSQFEGQVTHPDKSRLKRWLKSRKLGLRLLLGAIFVFILAVFLHFREVRIEVLELNAAADRYLIAQVDFEFPDEEATMILKQESVRDIGRIFRIDEKQILKKRYEFEDFLIHNQKWRDTLPKVTFEELYYGADQLKDALLQSRFTDERTLSKIKKFDLPSENFFLFFSDQVPGPMLLDEAFWNKLKLETFDDEPLAKGAAAFLVQFFSGSTWNLQEDLTSERNLRHSIQEGLPEVYTRVEAGSRVIDSGEKVSMRHISMLRSMKDAMKESRNLWQPLPILGSFLLSLIFTFFVVLFFRMKHPDLLRSLQKLTLLVTITVLTLGLAKLTEFLLLSQETKLVEFVSYPLLVPLASFLLCILLGTSVAFFISAFLTVILSITLAFDHDRFLVINLIAALVAIIMARKLHKRKEIFIVCGKVWVSTIPMILAYNLVQSHFFSVNLMADLSSALFFMVATAILVIGVLPLFESINEVGTDMRQI